MLHLKPQHQIRSFGIAILAREMLLRASFEGIHIAGYQKEMYVTATSSISLWY